MLEKEFVLIQEDTLFKPAKFMEDMTYDMAGSATVVGLMKSLAIRKAKINAVGVVGLVENMVRRKCTKARRYCKII